MVRGSFTCRHVHSTITGLQHGYFPRGGRFDSASAVQRLFVVIEHTMFFTRLWAQCLWARRENRGQTKPAIRDIALATTGPGNSQRFRYLFSVFHPSVTFTCTVTFHLPLSKLRESCGGVLTSAGGDDHEPSGISITSRRGPKVLSESEVQDYLLPHV